MRASPARRALLRAFRATHRLERWVLRRFTGAGRLALATLGAATVVGLDTNRTLGHQVVSLVAALLLVAMLGARPPRGRLTVARALPRLATAGERLSYRVTVSTPEPRGLTGLTVEEEPSEDTPTVAEFMAAREPEERGRNWFDRTVGYPRWQALVRRRRLARFEAVPLPPLPPGGSAEARCELVPARRGWLRLAGLRLTRVDPLGLVRAWTTVAAPASVLVLPRRYPVSPLPLPGARRFQRGGVSLAGSVGDAEEFVSLRDYRPGDPLRRVHWRSWARTRRPIVREYQDQFFVRHALVLDTFTADTDADEQRLEAAVSVAASIAAAPLAPDALLDLLFVGDRAYAMTAGRGVGHADGLLEVLASVGPAGARPFRDLHEAVIDRAATLSGAVLVLLTWDSGRRALAAALRAHGVPTLALVLGPATPSASAARSATPDESADPAEDVVRLRVGHLAEDLARL